MKNVQQSLKRWPIVLGMVCTMAFMLSSCLKSHDNDNQPAKPLAALTVINASPDAPALDFFLNTDRVNTSPLPLGSYINYFNAYAGTTTATFYQSGTSTVAAQDTITLGSNHYYSLFFANVKAKADLILLRDSIIRPASGSISVRLVNASPDAGPVDLVVKGSGAKIVQSEPYKSASDFLPVSVNATDSLQVRQAGSPTVLATVPASKFVNGTVYTVWLYGLANTSVATQKLKAGIMVNAYFY